MKTERRHELQKNELADQIAHGLEAARPYSRLLGAVLLAIVVLVGGYSAWAARQSRRQQQAWDQYFAALDMSQQTLVATDPALDKARNQLSDLAEKYPGTPVAYWAGVVAAELELDRGTKLLLNDKPQAKDHITRALDGFRTVLNGAPQGPLPERALFGLARAHESLGQLEEASREYSKLVKDYPNAPYVPFSKERIEDLKRTSTKQLYDWLASYQPRRPLANEPGTPGKRPEFSTENLGGEPDFKIPSVVDEKLPSAGKTDGGIELPKGSSLEGAISPPQDVRLDVLDNKGASTKIGDDQPGSQPPADKTTTEQPEPRPQKIPASPKGAGK